MAFSERDVPSYFKIEKTKPLRCKIFLLSFVFIGSVLSISQGVGCEGFPGRKDRSKGACFSQRPAPDSPQILCGNYPLPVAIGKATEMWGCSKAFLKEEGPQPRLMDAYFQKNAEENTIEPELFKKLEEDYNRLKNFKELFEKREKAAQILERKRKAVEDAASNITPVREVDEDDGIDEDDLDDFELIPSSNDKKDHDKSQGEDHNIETMEVVKGKETLSSSSGSSSSRSSSSSSSSWGSFASIGMSYLNEGITFISKQVENLRLTKAQEEYEAAQRKFTLLDDHLTAMAEGVRKRYAALIAFGKNLGTHEQIKSFADHQRPPTRYHPPYQKKPSDFKRAERFLAFVEDPLDFEITLFRLPGLIERLKQENNALTLLNDLYKQHIGSLKTEWRDLETWKARVAFLRQPHGAIETIVEELKKSIPFNNPAKYRRDLNSYEQMVLNVLHLDDLGLYLKRHLYIRIPKIPAPLSLGEANGNALERGKEISKIDERYWVLPKNFEEKNKQAAISFKEIYTGPDLKEDMGDFYKISKRLYQREAQGLFEDFVIQEDLVIRKEPKAKLRGAHTFRKYALMDFHRTHFIGVLEQLNSKMSYDEIFKKLSAKTFRAIPRKVSLPILIGSGEGLTKPIELDPTDAPLGMRYPFLHMDAYYPLYQELEGVLAAQRGAIKQLYDKEPTFLGNFLPADQCIPSPIDFISFIIPARLELQRTWDTPQAIDLEGKDIEDRDLEKTYPISSHERRGLFHCCSWLNLNNNSLKNPKSGDDLSRLSSAIDFSSLTYLDVSHNELTNVEFLDGLWGQLEVLKASSNSIAAFSPRGEMGTIPLHTLDLSGNKLHNFPLWGGSTSLDKIGRFINLRNLNISNNAFGTLLPLKGPHPLEGLYNLEHLEAKGCEIDGFWMKVLPSCLKKLTFLDLSNNPQLVLFPLPYKGQKTVTEDQIKENDGNFQRYFPELKVLIAERRKLEAAKGPVVLSKLNEGELIEKGEQEDVGDAGELHELNEDGLYYDVVSLDDDGDGEKEK